MLALLFTCAEATQNFPRDISMLTGVNPVPYAHPINQFRYVPIRQRQIRGSDVPASEQEETDPHAAKKDTAETETEKA